MTDDWIPADEWRTIVANAPIVSVDLVVRVGDDAADDERHRADAESDERADHGVLLGERRNPPAKGEWFVPGGRVRKNERLDEAVHRVAREELGVDVAIERRLGAYEHLYDASELDGVDSKHYLANGFVVRPASASFAPDDQHAELRRFSPPFPDVHPYVEAYLADAGLVE
ncbi:MAG: GDP-mannose mannosyl hydrolase [Haloferacaceae archaeon]